MTHFSTNQGNHGSADAHRELDNIQDRKRRERFEQKAVIVLSVVIGVFSLLGAVLIIQGLPILFEG